MRRLLLLVVGAVLLASCRLELDVNVAVEEDGSGSVEIVVAVDADGIERIGGDLAAVLEVDDLVEAGWVIDGPDLETDGYTRVRFRHAFSDATEAAAIFDQIAGDDGPFQDFAVRREASFANTEWGFSGRVDFSGGLEAFGDDALAAELDGEPLGQTVEEIEAQLGESLSRLIQVRVGVRLPGEVTSNATTKAGNGAVWQVGFGDGAVDLVATGEEQRTASLVGVGVGVVCLLLLVLYGLVRLAMRSTATRRSGPIGDDGAS
ncbi:MAG: hypothetical protein ABL966_10605 [Acidimicrobiales bacterium]